jgi:predicted alpha/beta superfamily hydrolase
MQNGVMIMAAKKDLRVYPAVFFHDDDAIAVRMDIVREEEAHRSITKSVTIPAYLNKLGIENNLNFSSILQEGLKERLGV